MGLDLFVYAVKKQNIREGNLNGCIELAYARKNWTLYNFFKYAARYDKVADEVWAITEDSWNNFMRHINPIYNDYDRTLSTSYKMIYKMDHYTKFSKHKWKVLLKYTRWAERFCDRYGYTTLGIDFDAGGYFSFARADREVRKYLADDDYEVIILASY